MATQTDALLLRLYQTFWPLKPPNRTRDRPMQVLALGLGRSGTDSLRAALQQLGYDGVYHGWQYIESADDSVHWCELASKKYNGDVPVTRAEFDKILGQCEAVSDSPCAMFARDLLKAYPEAKLIINRRHDVEAWHASMQRSIVTVGYRKDIVWFLSHFQPQTFWNRQVWNWLYTPWWRHDFSRYGREAYYEHYRELDELSMGRDTLRWKIEDGWAPLCEFLNKPIPEHEFPFTNPLGGFEEKVKQTYGNRLIKAARNLFLVVAMVGGAVGWAWRYRFR